MVCSKVWKAFQPIKNEKKGKKEKEKKKTCCCKPMTKNGTKNDNYHDEMLQKQKYPPDFKSAYKIMERGDGHLSRSNEHEH